MMLKKLVITTLTVVLTGCNVMPGMQNPDVSQVKAVNYPLKQAFNPTLTAITPALIANENMTKYDYHISPADILNIVVWNHPELTPKEIFASDSASLPSTQGAAGKEGYLVNQRGMIYFPLVGNVQVAGKTIEQVRIDLSKKLKKYLKNPELNVRVVDFRGKKIYVFGEAMKPGFIPITDQPISITDAISLSGGFDPNAADTSHVYVIRGNIYQPNIYWLNAKTPDALLLAEHFVLKPGDIIYISSAPATRWNRVLNQLLPTIQTIWYTKAIIDNK